MRKAQQRHPAGHKIQTVYQIQTYRKGTARQPRRANSDQRKNNRRQKIIQREN